MIVFFALVANGKNGHSLLAFNLKKNHISPCSKRNDHFAKQRVISIGFPAGKGEVLKEFNPFFNRLERLTGGLNILFDKQTVKTGQIIFCRTSKTNLVVHWP